MSTSIDLRSVIDQLGNGLTAKPDLLARAANSIAYQCAGGFHASKGMTLQEFEVLEDFMRIVGDQIRWRNLGFTRDPDFEPDETTQGAYGDVVKLTGDAA